MPTKYTVLDSSALAVLVRMAHYNGVRVLLIEPSVREPNGFVVITSRLIEVDNRTDFSKFTTDLDPVQIWWSSIVTHA